MDGNVHNAGLSGVQADHSGNIKDFFGTIPIVAAERNGHEDAVQTILTDKSSMSNVGWESPWWAKKILPNMCYCDNVMADDC
ncbi:hypothetical protein PLIIFM63780_002231 [Purpureocillium lilacinum]|nr:hypothetical protein PLIIFM63780_002231 [Purpureocillium lilacinum]